MPHRITFVTPRQACLLACLVLAACDAPVDPDGTTTRIASTHVLRAGMTENRPWIWLENGKPRGPEAQILEGFAASQGARIAWSIGAESPLLRRLEQRQLDAVAGGFTTDNPAAPRLGITRAFAGGGFFHAGHVFLTAPGENQLLLRFDRFLAAHPASQHG